MTPAAFNRTTGGGITFGNLFQGWPKDRIATVHNDPVPTTDETCDRYFRLGPAEIRRWGPLERIAPAAGRGNAAAATAIAQAPGVLRGARQLLFGDMLPDAGRLSAALEAWIDAYRPELLYTILGTIGMMELVDAVRRRFNLPMVVHFMDDWPAAAYRGGLLGAFARRRMERLVADLVASATARLGICDSMCDAYARRYGVPFTAFHNALDTARWADYARTDAGASAEGEILYVGSVLPFAQLESLAACCEAVARLGRAGMKVRLSIYSPSLYAERYRARLEVAPNIRLHDTITDDAAFFRRIARADALLLPVNFDAASVRLLRHSMPTKVPAYLFSGTPILAYGPDAVAQVRYAREHGWALVVGDRDAGALDAGLRRILGDAALRKRLSQSARRVALARHDVRVVGAAFQAALARAHEEGHGRVAG